MTIALRPGYKTATRSPWVRSLLSMPCGMIIVLAVHGQHEPIQVRFEPGCETVKAHFRSEVPGAVSYLWELGGGITSDLATPTASYPFGEVVSVALTTTDAAGTSTVHSLQFTTQDQLELSTVALPTVFTPNGDGHNDVFAPLTEHFLGACAQLLIYNRYGQLLFESLGNDLSWDGRTFAGEPANGGVYFYVFTWGGGTLNSTVTLLR
ncbi:MAG TPA: gliding motility-associated C-terminal domain-containing protein [Flavobacteriales bacterium]|nr:gliding motility-associated C-terminal domain-containing protein [Flavobacteriales bacterium]